MPGSPIPPQLQFTIRKLECIAFANEPKYKADGSIGFQLTNVYFVGKSQWNVEILTQNK